MPKDLKDFPRPPSDNGRGLHGSATSGWTGGREGYAYWIDELVAMGIKWLQVVDNGGDSLPFCEKLLNAGIFPIVRILRRDPPPNDLPEPNPGHIGTAEEKTIQRLIAAGVRYIETNNEPDLKTAWKHQAILGNPIETAKLVALNWLFDAHLIIAMGGLPGLPAVSSGGNLDLMGALVALGRQDVLLEGCWIAVHNYPLNRPLAYPDDPVNRTGAVLTPDQYDQGTCTEWVWWNSELRRVDRINEVNALRASGVNSTAGLLQDHACFREYEYYDDLAVKYLGRSIPIIGTEGGYLIGRREDPRYPRITPDTHRDQTVALFDFMQRQAPDYLLAAVSSLLIPSKGREMDAWSSGFWAKALRDGTDGSNGIPTIPMPGTSIGDRLPVINAVKSMLNLARRLPGTQPPPPFQPITVQAAAPSQPVEDAPAAPVQIPPEPEPEIASSEIAEPEHESLPSPLSTAPELPTWEPEQVEAAATPPMQSGTRAEQGLEAGAVSQTDAAVPATEVEKMSDVPLPPSPTSSPVPDAGKIRGVPPTPAKPVTTAYPSPSLLFSSLPIPRLDWDPRLDALNVSLEPAKIAPGQMFWKLIRAEYQGPSESDGKHHVFYTLEDEMGKPVEYQRVWQGWPEDKTDATTNEKGEANIPLWASFAPDRGETGQYSAWIDGLPSDRVNGLGLPGKRQVCFVFTWRRVIA